NDFAALEKYFTPSNVDRPEIHGGFVRTLWCKEPDCEEKINELKASIRCVPFEQRGLKGSCVVCGQSASTDIIVAKAY
ncbi:MAG: hypothetical protein KDD53_13235, partial [Bdellovibrionales bacterium]|nr:hypothetical protein [Bdellovibrionales bacterium]